MRINKLIFKNIASFKGENEINFDDPILKNSGIFLISGNTGAGKSTILDCITLSLYARVYRLGKKIVDSISKGSDNAYVKLTFTISGKIYESFIELSTSNRETPRNMILNCHSNNEVIEGRADVLDYIQNLCRLDFNQFCQTVILPQGNFQEFLISGPKEKTSIIDNIFNLQKYDNLELYIKKELICTNTSIEKLLNSESSEKYELDTYEKELKSLNKYLDLVDIEKLQIDLTNVKKAIVLCDQAITAKEKYSSLHIEINNLENQLDLESKNQKSLIIEYSLAEKLRYGLKPDYEFYSLSNFENLKNLVNNQGKLFSDLKLLNLEFLKIENDLKDLEELNNLNFSFIKDLYFNNLDILNSKSVKNNYQDLLTKQEKLEKQKKELLELQKQKNNEIKNISLKKSDFDFDKYIYYEALKLFQIFNEELISKYRDRLEILLKSYNSKENLEEENKKELDLKINLYKELLRYFDNKNFSIEEDKKQLKYVENSYREYQHKEKLTIISLKELDNLNSRFQLIQKKINELKVQISYMQEKISEQKINEQMFERNNAEILKLIGERLFNKHIDYSNKRKILNFENKMNEFEHLKNQFSNLKLKISLKEQDFNQNILKIQNLLFNLDLKLNFNDYPTLEKEFSIILNNQKNINDEWSRVVFQLENLKDSKLKSENKIEFIKESILKLNEKLQREYDVYRNAFLDLNKVLIGFRVSTDLKRSYNNLRDNEIDLRTLQGIKLSLSSKIESFSSDIREYNVKYSILQNLEEKIKKQKANLNALRKELSSAEDRSEKLDILKKVVIGSSGLKYYVQSFLINDILRLANEKYLKLIFPDFNLKINKESKEFDFLIEDKKDGGRTRTVKTLSGGEKFLVSLSLALALSDKIRDSELKIEAFFLDEGFGNLDEEILAQVIPKLYKFQEITGRQIGIISHVSYLKEIIKAQIIINKISKISSIFVENL